MDDKTKMYKKLKKKNNVISAYVFDMKRGFPLVKLKELTLEEEARLVKDALLRSEEFGV